MTHVVAFVCNRLYLCKFQKTYEQLRINGNYHGPVCLIVGDDLRDYEMEGVETIYLPEINFPDETWREIHKIKSDGRTITKKFQWHKMNLFHSCMKKWQFVFYIDCGMKILNDISPMLELFQENRLLAHSDAYPTFVWKLRGQFDSTSSFYNDLQANYDLDVDYFQTGILMYDTDIIENDTLQQLVDLAIKYPLSRTNEQGIMAIFFKKYWTPLAIKNEETFFYDFCNRSGVDRYIVNCI